MRFSVEQAFEAHEEGEPIWISGQAAKRIVDEHGASFDEFRMSGLPAKASHLTAGGSYVMWNAWTVLEWLGY